LLFFLNFSNESIHRDAEEKLAARIQDWRKENPKSKIDLIGHSAGCGVILGALARLPADVHISHVFLLAPSVSPQYCLNDPLAHVDEKMHVYFSSKDNLFLSWRTGNFGTYDNVKTRAAGNCGFDLAWTATELRQKIQQHGYQPDWNKL